VTARGASGTLWTRPHWVLMTKRHGKASDLATALGLAGMNAAITLWYRWPMLYSGLEQTGHAQERGRMLHEKTNAMIEGTFAAQGALLDFVGAAMTGRLSMQSMMDAPTSIMTAGLRPAFRTVKANARRLSRP
jgi:hypothetical protein